MGTPRVLVVPLVPQGDHPFCLYACTSMVLAHFGIDKPIATITDEVFLTVPSDAEVLVETAGTLTVYLRSLGFDANLLGPGDLEALTKGIDRPGPVIIGVRSGEDRTVDWPPNHAWTVRGYVPAAGNEPAKIVYNNPQRDPGNQDPRAWDGDGDQIPGQTIRYDAFRALYWDAMRGSDRVYIPVSYRGQGPGRDWGMGWRMAAQKNVGRWLHHTARGSRDIARLRPLGGLIYGALAGISIPAGIAAGLQMLGQAFETWGHNLIADGRARWNKGDAGEMFLGALEIIGGGILAGVGYILDFGLGVAGEIADIAMTLIEEFGNLFDGNAGDSASAGFGPDKIRLGLVLNVSPWESRWGKNWENVSGSWSVVVDGAPTDEMVIAWELSCWGWGVDAWNLARQVNAVTGNLDVNTADGSTRYGKTHQMRLTGSNGIQVSFSGRIPYGKDGGLTRVHLNVVVTARRAGTAATVEEGTGVYGLST